MVPFVCGSHVIVNIQQNGSIVSARKMKLRYDDDSDSDSEPTRRKHLDAVERRKSAAGPRRGTGR